MILYLFTQYNLENQDCLQRLCKLTQNQILLIDSAVFFLDDDIKFNAQVYVLKDSAKLYGVNIIQKKNIQLIDYAQWLELTRINSKLITY